MSANAENPEGGASLPKAEVILYCTAPGKTVASIVTARDRAQKVLTKLDLVRTGKLEVTNQAKIRQVNGHLAIAMTLLEQGTGNGAA